jgi:hypothetical protein
MSESMKNLQVSVPLPAALRKYVSKCYVFDVARARGLHQQDPKAVAGDGGVALAVCEPKIELPDLFNPAV